MNVAIRRRNIILGICSLWFGVITGCSLTARPSRFVNSFVPPRAAPAEPRFVLPEPPAIGDGLFAREMPLQFGAADVVRPAVDVEVRIRQGEAHFRAGSEALAKGRMETARLELDRGLETLISAPASVPQRARLLKKYQEMVEAIYRLEVDVTQNAPDQEPAFDKSPLDEIAEMTFPIEPGLKGKVKEQLQATVSQLPLEMADPVLSFINYFSTARGKKTLMYGLQRSGRYAPMIRRILDEEGVPQELIYLAQAESGFLPRAVSRMKATGMWQFMQFRGREYGLAQTPFTDDRLDPEKATRAAARHLRDLYEEFGDWYLAIAGYNCGPLNVERAVQRTGYADFWELYKRNVLPRETSNYLPIIIAMTIMAKNPEDYGLTGVAPDPPLEYDTIHVTTATHLALIADAADKPLTSIREMNPAVLKLIAPAGFAVRLPKGSSNKVLAGLEAIPAERRASWRVHRVSSSDTVASIARKYNTSEKSIALANGASALEPEAGDLVVVPVAYPGVKAPPPVKRKTATAGNSRKKPATARANQTSSPARATATKKAAPRPSSSQKTLSAARRTPSSSAARNP
jgi:membrane-bound lytic murein transglycosylase D